MATRTAYILCTDTETALNNLAASGNLLDSELCIITTAGNALGKVIGGVVVNLEEGHDATTFDSDTPAYYLSRVNHTGSQTLSTISDSGALAPLDTVGAAEIDTDAVTAVKIADSNVTLAKIEDLAADRLLGSVAGGAPEEITLTAAGRALLDDASAAAQRTTLGLDIGTDVQAYDADTAKLDANQVWAKAQRATITTLTDAATIAVDFSLSNDFTVTLGGNRTMGSPSNQVAGQSGVIYVVQDGTGSRTLDFHGDWKFASANNPTFSTGIGQVDMLTYHVREDGFISTSSILYLS